MRRYLLIIALLLVGPALRADQGTTAASFLKLGTSPRAIAMADSFAGIADDVSAIQYNAAGLGYLQQKELTLMHAVWFMDIFYDYGALAWPIKDIGTVSLSFFYSNYGDFDKYDLVGGVPVKVGKFSGSAMVAGLGYSRVIIPSLSAGINIKMLNEAIEGFSAGTVAVDLSALYKSPVPGLTAGINIQNLGPNVGYDQAFTLPINVRLGVAYRPLSNVVVDVDYTQPIETAGIFSLGGEYGYRDTLFARLGYKYQGAVDYNQTYQGYGPSVAGGLNLGLGLKLYKSYYADYAYSPYGFLGTSHRVSLTVKF